MAETRTKKMEAPHAVAPRPPLALPEGVRWLFLDLDGTLWNHDDCSRGAIYAACRAHGVPPEPFFPLFHLANLEAWARLERGEIPREAMRVERFSTALEALDSELARRVDADQMSQDYLRIYMETLAPHAIAGCADVMAALRRRRAELPLAILTNGSRDTQTPKIDVINAADVLALLWTPDAAGCLKPEAAFFTSALRRVGCEPREVLMIGDSIQHDIRPALDLGMHAWWYADGQDTTAPAGRDILHFSHLSELARAIEAGGPSILRRFSGGSDVSSEFSGGLGVSPKILD